MLGVAPVTVNAASMQATWSCPWARIIARRSVTVLTAHMSRASTCRESSRPAAGAAASRLTKSVAEVVPGLKSVPFARLSE